MSHTAQQCEEKEVTMGAVSSINPNLVLTFLVVAFFVVLLLLFSL